VEVSAPGRVLFVHGLIHLLSFIVYWKLARLKAYKPWLRERRGQLPGCGGIRTHRKFNVPSLRI
jgi:hypothetical protein